MPPYLHGCNYRQAHRRQMEESISTASSVADTVRTGLENAFADLRTALLESRSQISATTKPHSPDKPA